MASAKDASAGGRTIAQSVSPANEAQATEPALGEPKPVNELTPEQQMALFEKELKEKDWGHQPC